MDTQKTFYFLLDCLWLFNCSKKFFFLPSYSLSHRCFTLISFIAYLIICKWEPTFRHMNKLFTVYTIRISKSEWKKKLNESFFSTKFSQMSGVGNIKSHKKFGKCCDIKRRRIVWEIFIRYSMCQWCGHKNSSLIILLYLLFQAEARHRISFKELKLRMIY